MLSPRFARLATAAAILVLAAGASAVPASAQQALNAYGGSAILNGGSLASHSIRSVSTMAGSYVSVSPRVNDPLSSWQRPAVSRISAAAPSSHLNGLMVSAGSVSSLGVASIARGAGAASTITGLSVHGSSSIVNSRIGTIATGAGAFSSLSNISLSSPSAVGNSFSALAIGNGAGATARISDVSIAGTNSVSGNRITAFACGSCR